MMRMGERIFTMKRLFNIKMGLTTENDSIPEILLTPTKEGAVKGKAPNFNKLKQYYYQVRNWDPITGKPSHQKLKELGLDNFENITLEKSQWADGKIWVCKLLTLAGACKSNSDARRLIGQKAVVLDGKALTDANLELPVPEKEYLFKVGKKKFLRILANG